MSQPTTGGFRRTSFILSILRKDEAKAKTKPPPGPDTHFKSRDEEVEIRISATYDLNLPEALLDYVLKIAFPNEHGATPITKLQGNGWDGLRRE